VIPNIDDGVFIDGVVHYWSMLQKQGSRQVRSGVTDQGGRSRVTGGAQMDGFAAIIVDHLVASGIREDQIFTKQNTLPGYFRPTKDWDILVKDGSRLVAAIEMKSQAGPSFGNNANNRAEEALGNAEDIWTAFREGAFDTARAPWVGYLFLLEQSEKSMSPVAVKQPHYGVFPEFKRASYAKRYEELCKRLMLERKYSAACLLLTPRPDNSEEAIYSSPVDEVSGSSFLRSLIGHVTG